jgi:hypothetical protein
MSSWFTLERLAIAAVTLVAGAACFAADDKTPAPDGKAEDAVGAVDLQKAKKDKKLARQAEQNEDASKGNLQEIGMAVHKYSDDTGFLPDDVTDKKGKPLLSWRVLILPQLSKRPLYQEFRLDEPWDSKHNKALLEKMPDVFRSPRVKLKAKSNTVYQAFHGPDAVFGRGRALKMTNITDGTSNTIMVVESSTGVPWTKPGGLPFDRKKELPAFGKAYDKRPLAVLMDGDVRVLDLNKIKPETLKNAIDPGDGNVLGADWN